MDHRVPIWHRSSTNKTMDGKLVGAHSWPFSFPFPQEVCIPGRESETFPAPQTFLERGTNANVQYDLVLRITHGLLRPDSKLQTGVVYVPDIKPGPSSFLSQQAYRDGRIAPPPHLDPAGWLMLPKVLIRGQLLGYDVGLECLVTTLLHLDKLSPTYDQFKTTAVSCKSPMLHARHHNPTPHPNPHTRRTCPRHARLFSQDDQRQTRSKGPFLPRRLASRSRSCYREAGQDDRAH